MFIDGPPLLIHDGTIMKRKGKSKEGVPVREKGEADLYPPAGPPFRKREKGLSINCLHVINWPKGFAGSDRWASSWQH
jgi:hypothetical protein